ncbi:MAG: prepilin-type N-terminal cleavage/methylation domain-containing protein [Planctomycetota bacterium]
MQSNQNETRPLRQGFTLVELLVVITIIGVLAALGTAAALNAFGRGKQVRVTLEMQQLANAIEQLKNEYGAYPPNVFPNDTADNPLPLTAVEQARNANNVLLIMKKAAPRSTEFNTSGNQVQDNITTISFNGLSPAEALVFWLQGFSSDPQRPLTGTDLQATTIDDNGTNVNGVLTIDSFTPSFEFDETRLRLSRNESTGERRFLTVHREDGSANGIELQIQLYEYLAPGTDEPYVYFDTSRETPQQVLNNWATTEFFYSEPNSGGVIFPLKKLKENAPTTLPSPQIQFVEYVNQGKFQLLHSGLDNAWGNFGFASDGGVDGRLTMDNADLVPALLYPDGPFLGDIADTLGHFYGGELADESE